MKKSATASKRHPTARNDNNFRITSGHKLLSALGRLPSVLGIALFLLAACGDKRDPLAITTTTLPYGQVGKEYHGELRATGGNTPYRWRSIAGSLPPGLTVSAGGVISGIPTQSIAGAQVTFQVADSYSYRHKQAAFITLPFNISPASIAVDINAEAQGITAAQTTSLAFNTNDLQGVQWSISPEGPVLIPPSPTDTSAGEITFDPSGVTGIYTVTATSVTDPDKSTSVEVRVSPDPIEVSLSAYAMGITVAQATTLSVNTTDLQGVTWSVSAGGASISATHSLSGESITFTPNSVAAAYTVTATSVTDPTKSASAHIGVTDLSAVLTYHNNASRDGTNDKEYALTPETVSTATFGKLFSCQADGAIYAQPLWVADLEIGGARRNVVFVATAHNGLFAYDADTKPCVTLWSADLIDPAHGGTGGEAPVPAATSNSLVGSGGGSMSPEIGVTSTPVIDSTSQILYVVSSSVAVDPEDGPSFYQRLHAIDLLTGLEKPNSPVLIEGEYPANAQATAFVRFDARRHLQRSGLALVNGVVHIAFASHEDSWPWWGWLMGYRYDTSGFVQASVFNVSPQIAAGGIWMAGSAPAADTNGDLFVITGNGVFTALDAPPSNMGWSNSLLRLSASANPQTPYAALQVTDHFTPSNHAEQNERDLDFGGGGAAVLADLIAGDPPRTTRLILGGGKDGTLHMLDRDNLGGLGSENAWQSIQMPSLIMNTAAFWNNTIYILPFRSPLRAYALATNSAEAKFALKATSTSPAEGFRRGETPSISADGTSNGIVWLIETNNDCTAPTGSPCKPAILHAYDASSLVELWNSSMAPDGVDTAGNAVKFTVPTIANGKVYIGTRGNNTGGPNSSSTEPGQLDVYGLKPD